MKSKLVAGLALGLAFAATGLRGSLHPLADRVMSATHALMAEWEDARGCGYVG